MVIIPLDLPPSYVLGKEHFYHLLEAVERMRRLGVEPI